MQAQWFTVIPGAGLRDYLSSRAPALAERIDPDGTNVCVDGWRSPSGHRVVVQVLLKTLGSRHPVEATLELPAVTFSRLARTVHVPAPGKLD